MAGFLLTPRCYFDKTLSEVKKYIMECELAYGAGIYTLCIFYVEQAPPSEAPAGVMGYG